MKRLMSYKIISGKTVEERKAVMDTGRSNEKKRRGQRVKGRSTLTKIQNNEREAVKILARTLNCNFGAGDLWLTLTYGPDRLPADVEAGRKDLSRFMRNVRRAFAAEHGRNPQYVTCTSVRDSKTGEAVRLHHHVVMERAAYEIVCRLWPQEDLAYRLLDGRGDYTGIARYMVSQADNGTDAKKWSTSRGNMAKPIYTEPVPVTEEEQIKIPAGAVIREQYKIDDRESGQYNEYVRYTDPGKPAPKKPKDRKPRKKKRKTRQHKKH